MTRAPSIEESIAIGKRRAKREQAREQAEALLNKLSRAWNEDYEAAEMPLTGAEMHFLLELLDLYEKKFGRSRDDLSLVNTLGLKTILAMRGSDWLDAD